MSSDITLQIQESELNLKKVLNGRGYFPNVVLLTFEFKNNIYFGGCAFILAKFKFYYRNDETTKTDNKMCVIDPKNNKIWFVKYFFKLNKNPFMNIDKTVHPNADGINISDFINTIVSNDVNSELNYNHLFKFRKQGFAQSIIWRVLNTFKKKPLLDDVYFQYDDGQKIKPLISLKWYYCDQNSNIELENYKKSSYKFGFDYCGLHRWIEKI